MRTKKISTYLTDPFVNSAKVSLSMSTIINRNRLLLDRHRILLLDRRRLLLDRHCLLLNRHRIYWRNPEITSLLF